MLPPPRGISLYQAGTEGFTSFFDASIFGGAVPGDGVVVKHQPCSLIVKIGMTALLLFFAIGSYCSPEFPPLLSVIFTCGALVALWCLINSRFEEMWLYLDAKQLIIKRWKYLIPGPKVTRLQVMDICAVRTVDSPHIHRAPATYTLRVALKGSRTLAVATEVNSRRIRWLTEMLSSWRDSGGGWRQIVRQKGAK